MRPTSTLVIRDRIAECCDGRVSFMQPGALKRLAIHRISLEGLGIADANLDGPGMCAAFQDPKKVGGYTGKQNPYTFLVRAPEGMVEQCTPIMERNPHSVAWNSVACGIAVVGDFRRAPPDERQWWRTVILAAALSVAFELEISGHDELGGGSRDRAKRCPGDLWSMHAFRHAVKESIRNNRGDLGTPGAALSLIARSGVVKGG